MADTKTASPSYVRSNAQMQAPNAPEPTDAQMTAPIMIAWDAPWAQNYRLAPYNQDAFIVSKGYDTLDWMRTIAAYNAPLTVVSDAAFYKLKPNGFLKPPADVLPGSDDHKQAQEMAKAAEWHLSNIVSRGGRRQPFREVVENLFLAYHHGFSVNEIQWRYVEDAPDFAKGQLGFEYFGYKRCKQIGFELDPVSLAVCALTNYTPVGGGPQFQIPVRKVLMWTFRAYDALPYGRGVARECYKHVWMLDTLYKIWSIALQLHGIPHYLVYAPTGDDAIAEKLRAAFDAVRQGASLVVPEGVQAELQQIQQGGLGAFREAIAFHCEQIMLAIVGQQLTMQQGLAQGSYALGAVQQGTQEYIVSAIRRGIEFTIGDLMNLWVTVNYGPEKTHLTPRLDLGDWDAKDITMLAQAFSQLISAGMLYAQEPVLREMMGLPPLSPEDQKKMEEQRQEAFKQQQAQQNGGNVKKAKPTNPEGGGDHGGETD